MSIRKSYIIAELSANHNNDINLAIKTIEAIAQSGADAVKVQTYKPESLTINVKNEFFQEKKTGLWKGYRPYVLYEEASMPYEWQPILQKKAHDLKLDFFSSPFDLEAVDFLESLHVPKYKIASFEITDIPLIKYAASKGKPMIISTGVAEVEDIKLALQACKDVGNNKITLLKCTSNYPAELEDANLLTIPDMQKKFLVDVGVSDHTMGSMVPVVAVSLGAKVIEKHFTLDRSIGGPDSTFSMEPNEFKKMVDDVRNVEKALGKVTYQVNEKNKLRRRSLFVCENVKKGDRVSNSNLKSVRPGHGLHPKYYDDVIGGTYIEDVKQGIPFQLSMIEMK